MHHLNQICILLNKLHLPSKSGKIKDKIISDQIEVEKGDPCSPLF